MNINFEKLTDKIHKKEMSPRIKKMFDKVLKDFSKGKFSAASGMGKGMSDQFDADNETIDLAGLLEDYAKEKMGYKKWKKSNVNKIQTSILEINLKCLKKLKVNESEVFSNPQALGEKLKNIQPSISIKDFDLVEKPSIFNY